MSSNENPLGASPKSLAAIEAYIKGLGRYPDGLDEPFELALAHYHGRGLVAENFVTTASGCDALGLIARAYLQKGDSAIICPPTFPTYQRTVEQIGAEVIKVPLVGDDFSYDLSAIRAAIKAITKVIYICNPNNPTGTFFGQEVFDELLASIPEDILIVYDEVYYHFSDRLPDAMAAVLAGQNIFLVHSFSKSYGLAGMRLGYGVARADIIQKVTALKNPFHLSGVALHAGRAALEDDQHVKNTLANNALGKVMIHEGLQALGVKTWPSETNFIMFEVPQGFEAEALVRELAAEGIGLRGAFGLEHHLRVSIDLPEANLAFLKAMAKLLKPSETSYSEAIHLG